MTDEYSKMQIEFEKSFNQDLTDDEIKCKKSGIIGDEAMPLGVYIWDKNQEFIEYYVQWLPHYRGDSHGIIYKDGRHEDLETLPQVGPVTQAELDLRKELEEKGLLNPWSVQN